MSYTTEIAKKHDIKESGIFVNRSTGIEAVVEGFAELESLENEKTIIIVFEKEANPEYKTIAMTISEFEETYLLTSITRTTQRGC